MFSQTASCPWQNDPAEKTELFHANAEAARFFYSSAEGERHNAAQKSRRKPKAYDDLVRVTRFELAAS